MQPTGSYGCSDAHGCPRAPVRCSYTTACCKRDHGQGMAADLPWVGYLCSLQSSFAPTSAGDGCEQAHTQPLASQCNHVRLCESVGATRHAVHRTTDSITTRRCEVVLNGVGGVRLGVISLVHATAVCCLPADLPGQAREWPAPSSLRTTHNQCFSRQSNFALARGTATLVVQIIRLV